MRKKKSLGDVTAGRTVVGSRHIYLASAEVHERIDLVPEVDLKVDSEIRRKYIDLSECPPATSH